MICKLSDYIDCQNGFAFDSKCFSNYGKYNVIRIKEIKDGFVKITNETVKLTPKKEFDIEKYTVKKGDVIFALTGDPVSRSNPGSWVGRVALYRNDTFSLLNQRLCKVTCDESVNSLFLYYYFRTFENFYNLASKATGSANQANISSNTIKDTVVNFPKKMVQDKVAEILYKIDEKIELNNKINDNLQQQAEALYKDYYENVSCNSEALTLDSFCNIFTGKKNSNANVINGKYKFFTCSPNPLQIDSFIYDGDAIIVSGNGAYTGRTRFYTGKFDLYQRTYACTLKKGLTKDYLFPLYWFVKFNLSKKIMGGTRGSAIPYIVMNDLAKYEIPFDKELFEKNLDVFKSITLCIQENENQNERLSELRDTLLPKLMSGEIDVSNIKLDL